MEATVKQHDYKLLGWEHCSPDSILLALINTLLPLAIGCMVLPWVHEKFTVKFTMSIVDACAIYMHIGCLNCPEPQISLA